MSLTGGFPVGLVWLVSRTADRYGGVADALGLHLRRGICAVPAVNTTDGIHDPGQSWNALTVGAATFKDTIDPTEAPGASVLASAGNLSPYSCTSGAWSVDWPLKPDIMFEGGNRIRWPNGQTDSLRSLDLLSVHHRFHARAFDTFWGTSAATVLASGMAARIAGSYPEYWPETIRALLFTPPIGRLQC